MGCIREPAGTRSHDGHQRRVREQARAIVVRCPSITPVSSLKRKTACGRTRLMLPRRRGRIKRHGQNGRGRVLERGLRFRMVVVADTQIVILDEGQRTTGSLGKVEASRKDRFFPCDSLRNREIYDRNSPAVFSLWRRSHSSQSSRISMYAGYICKGAQGCVPSDAAPI